MLGIITLSASFTPFIPSDTIDGQLGYLAGCLLASVAYLYVLGEALPKLPFLTTLDVYTYLCIFYIALIMIESSLLSYKEYAQSDTRDEQLIVFYVNLGVWVAIHLYFSIVCIVTHYRTLSRLYDFPTPMVFKEESMASTYGFGGN